MTTTTTEVTFSTTTTGVGIITLNRPKALNSITNNMVTAMLQQLKQWQNDKATSVIVFKGSGEKGFCAGGDIKTLASAKEGDEQFNNAKQFFVDEYELDLLLANYSKPIVSLLNGVVMGGGVGLTQGTSHRIITQNTKWAMPEMNIAFFPDVGGVHFLNQAPGYTGMYLALTAKTIRAADILYIGAADFYVEDLRVLEQKIVDYDWTTVEEADHKLDELIGSLAAVPPRGELAALQNDIDDTFHLYSVEDIVAKLRDRGDAFGDEHANILLSKSPVSLKVTHKYMLDYAHRSLEDTLNMDVVVAMNFLRNNDFYEGVDAVLIKKHQSPNYDYPTLEEVDDELVDSYFKA
ncbi:3-hydroxyisobutyryl-CoA hydrolase [Geomicrobium sp. JCM 19038]|uniref:3-hydroxyisobutyryl-CoA hydrolase n=1 Tax=Geomicrobium sp. JCM 19038 TaxID=1460635 RepID=UPI00045F33AE|nr:3-hydroxyisobutyryl-CoA hydrolase [Geomicrobium sp. JCM 19038]GAK07873.1 3-hydroxyisobutyryl-CoA hydrolase [Geomicrobium sp. JCM 19038]